MSKRALVLLFLLLFSAAAAFAEVCFVTLSYFPKKTEVYIDYGDGRIEKTEYVRPKGEATDVINLMESKGWKLEGWQVGAGSNASYAYFIFRK